MNAAVLLLLSGCYVSARGGPSYPFGDGERRGTTVEVLVGGAFHFAPGLPHPSPLGKRFAFGQSLGYKRAHAAGAGRNGVLYAADASVFVGIVDDDLLRADLSGGVGHLMALVEHERYRDGWALRGGGGVTFESVTTEPGAETSWAPIGAVTFEFTPVIGLAIDAIVGR